MEEDKDIKFPRLTDEELINIAMPLIVGLGKRGIHISYETPKWKE
jgi:hypothetical protein